MYEALQLHVCDVPPPTPDAPWQPEKFLGTGTIFVDPTKGSDANAGDIDHPLKTIAAAVEKSRNNPTATVNLRAGTYHSDTVQITAENNGLTIQSYNGELAVVSGAVPLPSLAEVTAWKPYKIANASQSWEVFDGENNVFDKAQSHNDTDTIKYVGSFDTVDECEAALAASPKGTYGFPCQATAVLLLSSSRTARAHAYTYVRACVRTRVCPSLLCGYTRPSLVG